MNDIQPVLSSADEVHLWVANTAELADKSLESRYEEALGADERDSYNALANAEHRWEYLISQVFLRDVLSHYLEASAASLRFVRNESGKPSLELSSQDEQALQFNLSHSAEAVVCAVTHAGAVGVDVENSHPDEGLLAMAEHYFAGAELESVQSLTGEQQQLMFARIWTLKEAYIKARGEGHTKALDSFNFECRSPQQVTLLEDGEPCDNWRFWSLQPIEGQTVAVAVDAPAATLRLFATVPFGSVKELSLTALGQVA